MALFTVKIGGQNMSPMQALKAGSKFSPQGKLAEGVFKTFKKAALGSAAIFGATMLYFMQLGAAALKGAIIGATIGGTAGAVVGGVMGFNIGLAVGTALAPFTFGLSIPVFTALGTATGIATGGFLGATIGAIAGGLIALGIASGSSTLFSMGVGAGVGGAIGGVVGFSVGTTIAATLDTLAIAACVATLIGCALIPVVAVANPVIIAVSTAVGAVAGAAVGAYTGYLIGHYVIPAFTNTYITVKEFFGGAAGAGGAGAGAVGGFFAAAGSFLTGAASFFWNNVVVGGAKAAWGFVSGLVEKGVGVLSSAAGGGASIAAPAVGGAVGTVVVGSTIVGIVTSTAFFNPEVDNVLARVGDTPYMTVSKIASPNRIRNDDLPKEITFFITIKAKYVALNNIDIQDKMHVEGRSANFDVTTDVNGNSVTEPCQSTQPTTLTPGRQWNCQFKIRATTVQEGQDFTDSLITNILTVNATITNPNGQTQPTATAATALVIIGGPPINQPIAPPPVPGGTGDTCALIDLTGTWTDDERTSINGVCAALDRAPTFAALLGNAGSVTLKRVGDGSLGSGVCGSVNGANTISIGCDMTSESFAKYVITHELGHVIANYNGTLVNTFIDVFNEEFLMPTYPFGGATADESFAEMIADYVVSKTYGFPARAWSGYPGGPWVNPGPGWTTFQNDRPLHYNFARQRIFGNVVY